MTATTFFTDNFNGTGALDAHVSDSGHTWGPRPGSGSVAINLLATAAVTSGTVGRFGMASAACPAGDPAMEFVFSHLGSSANIRVTSGMLIDPGTQACFGVDVIRLAGSTSLSIYNGDAFFNPSVTGVAASAMAFGGSHTVRTELVGGNIEVSLDGAVVYSAASTVNAAGWQPLIGITSGVTNDTQILSATASVTLTAPIDFWEQVTGASQV